MTDDKVLWEIRQSARDFSFDTAQDSVFEDINAMSGYDAGQPDGAHFEEDINGQMSLEKALALLKFRQLSSWQDINEVAESLLAEFDAKKGLVKLPAHERTANSDRAEGIREFLTRVGAMFQEATARIAAATGDERLLIGSAVQLAGDRSAEKTEAKAHSAPVDAKTVARNTKAAISFFESEKK
jgi:hypothetical protein